MGEYRVNLDVYNGPLDLLLYLIRREEVEIYDIPIVRITEQYLAYVEFLKQLDPNVVGDFLVLAATLMEIKTRMLLPSPPADEVTDQDVAIDPRSELVRQLLEYKTFRDAAGDLREAAAQQAMKFPRPPGTTELQQGQVDLEDVQIWDLLDAFGRLMSAIGQGEAQQEVIYDDTPVELHETDILDRLRREGAMLLGRIFEGRTARGEIVGLFLALLELIRRKMVFARQDRNFGEIQVHLNPDPPTEAESAEETEEAKDAKPQAAEAEPTAAGRDADRDPGEYVSDAPEGPKGPPPDPYEGDDDDEDGTATQGARV